MTDKEQQLLKILKKWHEYATSTIRQINDQWIADLVKATGEVIDDKPMGDKDVENS